MADERSRQARFRAEVEALESILNEPAPLNQTPDQIELRHQAEQMLREMRAELQRRIELEQEIETLDPTQRAVFNSIMAEHQPEHDFMAELLERLHRGTIS